MHTYLDCVPCFLRQALDASRCFTSDEQVHEQVVREILHLVADLDLDRSPPMIGQLIHRRLRELTGVDDPYLSAKQRFNSLVHSLLPELRAEILKQDDPLISAAKLAIAANVIDLGVKSSLSVEEVRRELMEASQSPTHGDWEEFRKAVSQAPDILYLADNAGEIVIDQLLMEQMGYERITLAVRGSAVLNDVTMDDVRELGLDKLVNKVMDNGSDAPGTILDDCSPTFSDTFHKASLIIAKGQGNYETLSGTDAPIFYLLKVKCPVIAEHMGLPLGTHAVVGPGSSTY